MKTDMAEARPDARAEAAAIFRALRERRFTRKQVRQVAALLEAEAGRLDRAAVLRDWREKRQLTVPEAARALGLPEAHLAALEAGTLRVGPVEFKAVLRALRQCEADLFKTQKNPSFQDG